ncbi:unnamed protein product [Adineta steineri]|uniref:Uncharacterized protein n=1 Tax=Adineta steineri TaxID=433720 RepID=A0A815W7M7_9BILA|nr:unnamed protein product [Adineta steineri]CAF1544335.1 unnamed protein product [Adineta steineri]
MRTTVERLSKSSASSRRRIVPINQRDFESIRDATSIGSRTARVRHQLLVQARLQLLVQARLQVLVLVRLQLLAQARLQLQVQARVQPVGNHYY